MPTANAHTWHPAEVTAARPTGTIRQSGHTSPEVPGLGIIQERCERYYNVTHLASGLAVATHCEEFGHAVTVAEAMLAAGDWLRPSFDLLADAEFMARAQHIRAQSAGLGLCWDITTEAVPA